MVSWNITANPRSLPHRQLRNMSNRGPVTMYYDHCRIGSLEKAHEVHENDEFDHCRIGSLERLCFVPVMSIV